MKKILYFIYYIRYKLEHGKEMTPVCYNEWLDNEYEEQKRG
jgi:hypothetical protein